MARAHPPTEAPSIPDTAGPLLATKHARPPLAPNGIARPDLFATLASARGLVLVSAPPGYGKSTLVSSWLEADGRRTAWVTLDESDNDPAVFGAYLAAAVRGTLPDLGLGVDRALGSGRASVQGVAPLVNALAASGTALAIVLDDYHLVTSQAVHGIVTLLVRHLPPDVLLVLATRHDPPLPLARLRAHGMLTEVRAADLRFSPADAGRFLVGSMGLALGERTVERLTEQTEGWVAGLQLAALSLRDNRDPDAFVDAFGSTDRYIFDYLTDEAVRTLPDATRTFLEATCVLERLTGPLCDALTGGSDGVATLEALVRANLFLTPLDERRTWFRYHRLFADLVASTLPEERRRGLHREAGAWFAANGHPGEGIRHLLAAGDADHAAALMEVVAEPTLVRGELRTVVLWGEGLPDETLERHPGLVLMLAWARFVLGDIAGAEATLARFPDPRGQADVSPRRTCLEAWFANRHDRPEAEILARRAVAGIPESDPVFRSLAFTTLGESLVTDDVRAATDAFEEAHRLAVAAGRVAQRASTSYSLAHVRLIAGRRREAEALCRGALEELAADAIVPPAWLGVLHLPLGVALFEADELVPARQHLSTGHELVDRAGLRVTMLGAAEWQEVLVLHLLGERDRAWRRMEAVRRDAERHGIARVVTGMTLLAAELALLEGDPEAAGVRIATLAPSSLQVIGTVRNRGRLTKARVHLALGRPHDALSIAEPLATEQRAGGRLGRLAEVLLVAAVAHERLGDRSTAGTLASEAVRRAAPESYRRAFLDPSLPVAHLLAPARPVAPAFVDELLRRAGAVGERATEQALRTGTGAGTGADAPDDLGPVERLSPRELEILRLVASGLSNEEIGRALFVTAGTAKWHVHNVLGKLGARNRVGLVARARSLGLV